MPVARQVAIAAIVGSTAGAVAGLWSVGQRSRVAPSPAVQPGSQAVVTGSSSVSAEKPAGRPDAPPVESSVLSVPATAKPAAAAGASSATNALGSLNKASPLSAGVDGSEVLQRARVLAQRPDVNALAALRDSVVRHAAERGETASAASKQQLDQLDRYLEEARLLRLKLDAEEFRHADVSGNRRR